MLRLDVAGDDFPDDPGRNDAIPSCRSGKKIYWTWTSAGVIVLAEEAGEDD